MSKILQRGDKLYHVLNGVLEVVTFVSERPVEEPFVKGSCETVFTCSKIGGGKFDCSMDMYERTELEAWHRYAKECLEAETSCAKAVDAAQEALDNVRFETEKAIENIRRLTKGDDR